MTAETQTFPARLTAPFSAGERELLERIAAGDPLPELLEGIVRLVELQAEGMFCSILVRDGEQQRLRHGAAPSLPAAYNQTANSIAIAPEMGSCGSAAYLGERVIVEDIDSHPYWASIKHLALAHGLRACWSTPIFSPTREVLGTFAMYYGQSRGPSRDELAWVDAATNLAAIALCRDAADRALQQSEARYRLMVDTAYEGIWLIDADGRTTFANHRIGEMLGYTPEEMMGMSMFDFMDETAQAEAAHNFSKRKSGISEQHEFRFKRKDGSDLWTLVAASPALDERGEMTAALGMVTDITKRKMAEAAVLRSEAEFRAIFEGSALGMVLMGADGRLQKCNPALENLLGYTSAELHEITISQITHPEDFDPSLFQSLIDGHRDSYRYEKRYLRKDGSVVWVRITTSTVRETDGVLRYIVGMVEDITQRREADDERTRLESQLRQSQKMQSLGTLAGGIAHDFNNVLAAITGNTQLAIADLPPGHPALISLAEVERASSRAADLVRQILAFSRPQESNRQTMKLDAVVDEALRLLRASLPSTITIKTSFDIATPRIAAHATQMHQVIMNLGANAAHAIGDSGGRLDLELAPFTVDAAFARSTPGLQEGLHARLTVRDDGCGMNAATLERIFEPFFSTKAVGHGTGLGLSVVHGIVRSHHGSISVQSEPGHGTTFHLFFPAAESVEKIEPPPAPAKVPPGSGERVLYVDDEERLIFLARRGLERIGYSFQGFTDPQEALQAFKDRPAEFDLVVTDLAMPGMTGLELAREILQLRPKIPILLTSGYLRPQDHEAARRLGLNDFMPKPMTLDTLGRMVHEILSRDGREVRL